VLQEWYALPFARCAMPAGTCMRRPDLDLLVGREWIEHLTYGLRALDVKLQYIALIDYLSNSSPTAMAESIFISNENVTRDDFSQRLEDFRRHPHVGE